jgi:hypothetical protein
MTTLKFGPGIKFNPIPLSAPLSVASTSSTSSGNTALISFNVPRNTGCVPITQYVAISNPGNITGTVNQSGAGTISIPGLTSGQTYTFTVTAYNWFGAGPASTSSNSILVATIPDPPTNVFGTFISLTTANISFTAPAFNGGTPILKYVATSVGGAFVGTVSQSGSGSITITGLSPNTNYNFTVTATNIKGTSSASTVSSNVYIAAGSQAYTSAGSYTWIAPATVTGVSVVAVGAGGTGYGGCGQGGGGGALAYKNNYAVSSGTGYTVVVGTTGVYCYGATGGDSYFGSRSIVLAGGGIKAYLNSTQPLVGDGGGRGGGSTGHGAGGGGAGGYSGAGGYTQCNCNHCGPAAGAGGGGGGGYGFTTAYGAGAGGGGVGILGQGCSGAAGHIIYDSCGSHYATGGGGGSGGGTAANAYIYGGGIGGAGGSPSAGGAYGGGGGGNHNSSGACIVGAAGGGGAVRIVWPGAFRTYPSTCVGSP